MANDEPVISDPAENFRRRVLLVVGGPGQGGWTEQLEIAVSLETEPDEVAEAVHVLVDEGLLRMMKELQMMSADADVALTEAGRRVVKTWEAASSQQSRMRAGCRAAVLAWLTVRAMLEDYRAGLHVDRSADAADRAAGRLVTCPTLVAWSSRDDMEDLYGDPAAIWRPWCAEVPQRAVIESGHHMAEENPAQLTATLLDFLLTRR